MTVSVERYAIATCTVPRGLAAELIIQIREIVSERVSSNHYSPQVNLISSPDTLAVLQANGTGLTLRPHLLIELHLPSHLPHSLYL